MHTLPTLSSRGTMSEPPRLSKRKRRNLQLLLLGVTAVFVSILKCSRLLLDGIGHVAHAETKTRANERLSKEEEEFLRKLLQCNADRNGLAFPEGGPIEVCVNGTLPRFIHRLPHFLPDTDDQDIFMMQAENQLALESDWIDWSWKTCFRLQDSATELSSVVVGLASGSFQHFHDNALPWVYQVRQAYDLIQILASKNCHFKEHIHNERPLSHIVLEEWALLGFNESSHRYGKEQDEQQGEMVALDKSTNQYIRQPLQPREISVELSRYPRDKDQVRVHPIHGEWLRSVFPPAPSDINRTKVVWVSRQGPRTRQLNNENAVVEHLQEFGFNVVYFNPSGTNFYGSHYGLRELVILLGDACAMVGIHGGAMYNQFFANTNTTVVELMPVDRVTKLLPGQQSIDRLPGIAHRAMWHNANVLGQPYWRIHFLVDNEQRFGMDGVTMERISRALTHADCIVT